MTSSGIPALRKNPKVPWEEFERHVKDVLKTASEKVAVYVEGKRTLKADDAEYEVDAYAEVELFGGATVKIIIECKRYTAAVKRDTVMALHRKTQEVGAHKAMLFATSGFQRGALAYALKHGIALVKLADGAATYMTRSIDAPTRVPDFVPNLVCLLRHAHNSYTTVGPKNPGAFREWLMAPTPTATAPEVEDDPTPEFDAPRSGENAEQYGKGPGRP